MLRFLSIQNYALIENVEIDFSDGLSIITGETGAGKSILLGALGLIIGQRADYNVIKKTADKCVVEGVFDIKNYNLNWYFEKHQLDFADATILRREIRNNGLSRAFINDTPVSLAQLKELGTYLVDIHSQHQNLLLADSGFQMQILDGFADTNSLLENYKEKYRKYKALSEQLNQLIEKERQARSQQDFIQFQFEELAKVKIIPGQLESMEHELATLENAEEIKVVLNNAIAGIGAREQNISQLLKTVKTQLVSIAKYNQEIEGFVSRIDSVIIELQDIQNDLEKFEEKVVCEPSKIEELTENVDALNSLLLKHRLRSEEELLELSNSLEAQLSSFASLEEDIKRVEYEIGKSTSELEDLAQKLSKKRKGVLAKLQVQIMEVLQNLGMPHAQIQIKITVLDNFSEFGKDKILFLFSGNKGGEFNDLGKVASGGEMSRIMLSVKSIMVKSKSLPTIVFDEIDTGVSGEIAYKLGTIMEEMSRNMQVIAITHLPQIACRGNAHMEVYKSTVSKETQSNIRILNTEERVNEIAKMLSGEKLSKAALENARTLLKL